MKEIVGKVPESFKITLLDCGAVEISLWESGLWPERFSSSVEALDYYQKLARKEKIDCWKKEKIIFKLKELVENNYLDKLQLKKAVC